MDKKCVRYSLLWCHRNKLDYLLWMIVVTGHTYFTTCKKYIHQCLVLLHIAVSLNDNIGGEGFFFVFDDEWLAINLCTYVLMTW